MQSRLESGPARAMRLLALATLLLGATGTAVELLLLGHYEEWRQWIPLLLSATLAAVAVAVAARPVRATLVALRAAAAAAIVAGALGLYFHYRGNAEFELEMYPTLNGLDLAWEALRGATPALAPGTMVQLGLLAWLVSLRHPAWGVRSEPNRGDAQR